MLLEQEATTVDETRFLLAVDNDLTIMVNHEQCGLLTTLADRMKHGIVAVENLLTSFTNVAVDPR